MNTSVSTRILGTRWLFLVFLAINVAIPFATHYYPTLDGPAHLHNAQLLKSYLLGDATIQAHFRLHPDPIPNWTDHGALALLLCVLPAWLAEKVLVCGFVVLMATGFRKLVISLAPANGGAALLVFPFIHAALFNFGFYNFSIGMALMLWVLALEWNAKEPRTSANHLRSALLITAVYFSNVLAFGLAFVLLVVRVLLEERRWTAMSRRLLPSCLAFAPGTLCLVLFQSHVHYAPTAPGRPLSELLTWLWDGRPFIAYGYDLERPYAHVITLVFLALFIFRLFTPGPGHVATRALLLATAGMLLAFLFVPDSFSAGMMNDRCVLLFFLLFALWLATSAPARWPVIALATVAACMQLCLAYLQWSTARRELDVHAQEVERASAVIPAGAIVYPVLLSDNWLHAHISNYLGADKPMIILENYEARLGWFPLRWREGRPAQHCLDGEVPYGVRCDSTAQELPDHVVLIGDTGWLSRPERAALKAQLRERYVAVPTDQDFVAVYRRKP